MTSGTYWINRYDRGGNSGAGSYGRLAQFKADVINEFIKKHRIQVVNDFGCGDGNQVASFNVKKYRGFDVSKTALQHCEVRFGPDQSKTFASMYSPFTEFTDLSLSLDVIYHLLEDQEFEDYMNWIFYWSYKYVIIYSTNDPAILNNAIHIKHRNFTKWVEENRPDFKLIDTIKNKYPYKGDVSTGSSCDFFIYKLI